MNILFVHDHVLKEDLDGNFYSITGIGSKAFFEKYSKDIRNDKLTLFTRANRLNSNDVIKAIKLDSDNVIVKPSKIYNKPIQFFLKHKAIEKEVENLLKGTHLCIIRLPSVLGMIVYKKAIQYKLPILIEIVGCPWDSNINYGGLKGKMFAPIMYLKTKKIIFDAEYVHYVSEKFLQKRYPTNGKCLSCSDVIISKIDEKALEKRIEKIVNKEGSKYIFGVVGSLDVNYKGHAVCIKALSLLKNKIDFELHFLGSGENKQKWIKLAKKSDIEDKIFFDGTLHSGESVFNWLDGLDIHLVMSKTEGLPRILVEAMSRASVSIGSNVGGIPELLDKDCLLHKNDYKGLAEKIEEIINSKNIQLHIAKRNFNKAKKFELEKLEQKRNKFYNDFLK